MNMQLPEVVTPTMWPSIILTTHYEGYSHHNNIKLPDFEVSTGSLRKGLQLAINQTNDANEHKFCFSSDYSEYLKKSL